MLVVGLTGGIGSGKSTVSALLAERGAVILDADAIHHENLAPGGRVHDAVLERFGTADRAALSQIVFNDPAALADLNAIAHPAVGAVIAERLIEQSSTDNVVVLDIPLLVESSKAYPVAGIIVVDAPVEVCVARLVEHRGMSEEAALARINAQASREERLARANYVIDNAGTVEELRDAVARCWDWILTLH